LVGPLSVGDPVLGIHDANPSIDPVEQRRASGKEQSIHDHRKQNARIKDRRDDSGAAFAQINLIEHPSERLHRSVKTPIRPTHKRGIRVGASEQQEKTEQKDYFYRNQVPIDNESDHF
jgi:hypothetical protein